LTSLEAILYGATILASYALFLLCVRRVLAVFGAVFLAMSPVHLAQLPQLRDYAKAPFIIAIVAVMAWMIRRQPTRRSLVLASGVSGALVGIGLGFRMDVLIMAPLVIGTVCVSAGAVNVARARWQAVVAFVGALALTALPVLVQLFGGSNGFHDILLGYSQPYYSNLQITPSIHGYGLAYDDSFVEEVIGSYAERGNRATATMDSSEGDRSGRAYWLAIVRHFPADVLIRALAASHAVLNLAFENVDAGFLTAPIPGHAAADAVFAQFRRLDGLGIAFAGAMIVAALLQNLRQGLAAAVVLFVLTAYPSAEFERRHAFHLQVLSILAVLVCANVGIDLVLALVKDRRGTVRHWMRLAPRALAVSALLVAAIVAPAMLVRWYQTIHLRRMFVVYVSAPKIPVRPSFTPLAEGVTLAQWSEGREKAADGLWSHGYYVMEFDGASNAEPVIIGARYGCPAGCPGLSGVIAMAAYPGVNRVFFPAYHRPGIQEFNGLEIPSGLTGRIRGISRIEPSDVPLPIDLTLSSQWTSEPLFERLAAEGRAGSRALRVVGPTDRESEIAWVGRIHSLSPPVPDRDAVYVVHSSAVSVNAGEIEMNGRAERMASGLLTFKPVALAPGGALVAEGHLDSGGLAVGLSQNGQWQRRLVVSQAGNFIVVLTVDQAGVYSPELTNAAPKDRWRSRFVLTRFGAMSPPW
jgi:hypothetical protein